MKKQVCGMAAAVAVLLAAVQQGQAQTVFTSPVVSNLVFAPGSPPVVPGVFMKGSTVVFTNMGFFSDSGATVTQELASGSAKLLCDFQAVTTNYTITVETNTWKGNVNMPIPTNAVTAKLQIKLTDSATNLLYYPVFTMQLMETID